MAVAVHLDPAVVEEGDGADTTVPVEHGAEVPADVVPVPGLEELASDGESVRAGDLVLVRGLGDDAEVRKRTRAGSRDQRDRCECGERTQN